MGQRQGWVLAFRKGELWTLLRACASEIARGDRHVCTGLDLRAQSGSLSSGLFQTSPCRLREQLWVRNRRCLGIRVSLWWEGSAVEGACELA